MIKMKNKTTFKGYPKEYLKLDKEELAKRLYFTEKKYNNASGKLHTAISIIRGNKIRLRHLITQIQNLIDYDYGTNLHSKHNEKKIK